MILGGAGFPLPYVRFAHCAGTGVNEAAGDVHGTFIRRLERSGKVSSLPLHADIRNPHVLTTLCVASIRVFLRAVLLHFRTWMS